MMDAKDGKVYRVRVAVTYTNNVGGSYGGETQVRYYGPYRTLGAAKTQQKRMMSDVEDSYIESAESEIQVAHITWEKVDNA